MNSVTASSAPGSLELLGVTAGYGATTVLRDVSVRVESGSVVALLGSNGAGKTTMMRAASGLIVPSEGSVLLNGRDVSGFKPHARAEAGLCLIPEGRGVFPRLTVRDNLRVQRPPWAQDDRSDQALSAFPVLRRRLDQLAGSLSGGEQQMLSLCRAYQSGASVVLLDEVSMGLAPIIVDEIYAALKQLAAQGVALLLVEQYVNRALDLANAVVVIDRGRIRFSGRSSDIDRDGLMRRYLGAGS